MTDKMKCYVCFRYQGGGGYSKPIKVFWYRKDAEAWVKDDIIEREYEEMEIDREYEVMEIE